MAIDVKLAKQSDVERLAEFVNRTCDDPWEWVKNRFEYRIKDHFAIIAEDTENGEIAGRMFFYAKENPLLGVGEIEGVQVAEGYQGQGVGSRMVELGIEESKKYFERFNAEPRCLYLFTRSSNEPAINLYKKFGFKKEKTIGKIFTDKEAEELVMARYF